MEPLEQSSNRDLLSHLTGQTAAESLSKNYSGLGALAQASFDELKLLKGIGESKAAMIKAVFLLGQRLSKESYADLPLIDTPERVADLLREENRSYTVETLQVILLNTRKRMIGLKRISQGTLDTILVHPREVFRAAIAANAAALILVHNHPSGIADPSEADIKVTRDLMRAGQLLKIEVVDHVILGRKTNERPRDYASLRELGYMTN